MQRAAMDVPKTTLSDLIFDHNPYIRLGCAMHPFADASHLRVLAHDEHPLVRTVAHERLLCQWGQSQRTWACSTIPIAVCRAVERNGITGRTRISGRVFTGQYEHTVQVWATSTPRSCL